MKISLRPVTPSDESFLYDLLSERTPEQSISHRQMPTMEEHRAFMASEPYAVWYIIESGHHVPVGQAYLTKNDEVGVFIKKDFQGHGFGPQAVIDLMRLHKRDRYLANINPVNSGSQVMFRQLGFKLIQFTYERRAPNA